MKTVLFTKTWKDDIKIDMCVTWPKICVYVFYAYVFVNIIQ